MLRHGGGVEGRDLRSLGNLIRVGARVLRPVVLVGEEVPRLRLISRQRGHDELRCHDGGGSRYWNSDERSKGDGRFKSWFMLPRGHEREGDKGGTRRGSSARGDNICASRPEAQRCVGVRRPERLVGGAGCL